MMLSVTKLIESSKECLGWPYVSPGSNDRNGIDCSGLFVKCFRDQGASIYHGSNTIWRKYLSEKSELKSINQLEPGMAVFKWKDRDTAKYPDGQGDFHHIGLVISVKPLRIIHASSAAGRVIIDTKLGKWVFWGRLNGVSYGKISGAQEAPEKPKESHADESAGVLLTATVCAAKGSTVNLRAKESTASVVLERVPIGTVVTVSRYKKDWCYVIYGKRKGYMMTEFLSFA